MLLFSLEVNVITRCLHSILFWLNLFSLSLDTESTIILCSPCTWVTVTAFFCLNAWMVSFLTGDAVLVSTLGKKHLQLCETRPGLSSAGEALQIVHVWGWTEDKGRNTTFTHPLCLSVSVSHWSDLQYVTDFTFCGCSWGLGRVQTDCSGPHTVESHLQTYAICSDTTQKEKRVNGNLSSVLPKVKPKSMCQLWHLLEKLLATKTRFRFNSANACCVQTFKHSLF